VTREQLVAAEQAVAAATPPDGTLSGSVLWRPYDAAQEAHELLRDRAHDHKAACEWALRAAVARFDSLAVQFDAVRAFCAACDVLDGGLSDGR
jgi:hypothetical protein